MAEKHNFQLCNIFFPIFFSDVLKYISKAESWWKHLYAWIFLYVFLQTPLFMKSGTSDTQKVHISMKKKLIWKKKSEIKWVTQRILGAIFWNYLELGLAGTGFADFIVDLRKYPLCSICTKGSEDWVDATLGTFYPLCNLCHEIKANILEF